MEEYGMWDNTIGRCIIIFYGSILGLVFLCGIILEIKKYIAKRKKVSEAVRMGYVRGRRDEYWKVDVVRLSWSKKVYVLTLVFKAKLARVETADFDTLYEWLAYKYEDFDHTYGPKFSTINFKELISECLPKVISENYNIQSIN